MYQYVPKRPPWRGRASIRSALEAHPGCLYLASLNCLIDVRRFCRSLPARCQNADERIPVAPGQKSAAFSSHFVFCCFSQNLRTSSKSYQGRIVPSRTTIADMRGFASAFGSPSSGNSAKAQVADRRGQIRTSRWRSWTHISPTFIYEEPIIEKKGLCGLSSRRNHPSPSNSAAPASCERL